MKRRQLLLGIGVTAGGGSIVSSGAFTSVEADRTAEVAVADDPDAFLRIGPCTDDNGDPFPNAEYVQLDGGTLTLDLTGDNQTSGGGIGVNADAVSRFDDVFEIRNQGTQPIGVWLETADPVMVDGEPRIEFYRSDDPDSDIVSDGSDLNAKCLDVGESICVGFIIRTEGLDDSDDETALFDTGTLPGASDEELVVNGDVNVACDVPGGSGGGSTDALYLTDTGEGGGLPDGQTTLYEVSLSTGPDEASLTELIQRDSGNFTQVDSLAATPDGDSLYLYDKNSGYLGRYDIGPGTFTEIGAVANDPGGIVLGEFSPEGELWVASQQDNTLYTVEDIDSAPSVDTEEGIQVDVAGADVAFAFTPDSVLYLWSSANSDEGLYEINVTATNPTAQAITPSPSDISNRQLTGLALKNPLGSTLLGSDKQQDEIVEIDTSTGLITQTYDIRDQNGDDYLLGYGDMASPSSVSVD